MKNHENLSANGADKKIRKHKLKQFAVLILLVILPLITFSQEKRVTIKKNYENLEQVLKDIQKQTGLDYIFNDEKLPADYKLSLDVKDETVTKVLEKALKQTNLSFKIVDKVIVIIPRNQKETAALTQDIRGRIVDAETGSPLPFATISIQTVEPIIGATSDEDGLFRIENVPIGRHNIRASFVGYETQIIPEILVTTGKEIVLDIKLKEKVSKVNEVQIKAFTKKDKPLNNMSTASARTFSVEEARRYGGGFDDPSRLATAFAGITTENSRDNTIIIRGNSPKGLLWRLEGVDIPNPNHFANLGSYGGGGISALSALVLGNSDFFTGAFPAEYGNAMSGVFDIKLRNGNNEKHEHAIQLGTTGIDVSSEGPITKNAGASYLFNYRYSTLTLMKEVFPEEIKDFIPTYQDLCFKINVPTKKAGVFSMWGLGSSDFMAGPAVYDSTKWQITMDRIDNSTKLSMGAAGLNHRYILTKKSWLNTTFSVSGNKMGYIDKVLDNDLNLQNQSNINVTEFKYSLTSVYNHKFSAKHSNRSGFIVDDMHYNINVQYAPFIGAPLASVSQEKGNSYVIQAFSQSRISPSDQLTMNAGLHAQHFTLNSETVLEPRLGITYNLRSTQSIGFAYGKHSRLEPLPMYFVKMKTENQTGENTTIQPNLDLKVSKAHHWVLSYDQSITSNLRLKLEPYYQFLYDVPVIPDSSYSVLNLETEWYSFNQKLVNDGTGRNYGVDLTVERFLNDGYYYLFTASVYDSKYKGGDGIEYNTRFNTGYAFNFLYGKEWILGEQKNKILGVNLKLHYRGGKRFTPINQEQSAIIQNVVYDYSRMYESKEPPKFYTNATVNYRINKKRCAYIWTAQMVNLFLVKENYGYFYNYKTKRVEPWNLVVPTPILAFKIEF